MAPIVSGLQSGDTVAATQVFDGPNAGTHILSVSNYTVNDGNNGNNYVVYSGNQAQGTIKRAPLTVSASDQEKTYGVAYDLGSTAFTTSGTLYGSDKITGVTLSSYGARATAAVGSQEIAVNNATGTGAGNYTITYVPGSLKIDKADLTITAKDQSKTYGDTGNLGTTAFTTSGLVNGDKVDSVILTSVGAWSGATVAGGPYAIKANQAQGSALYNYKITYVDGALTVGKADLTVTANNASKTYDGQAYSGGNGVSYSGFVNGEGASVLGGSVSYGGTAQGAVNAGSYTLTASGLSSSNYTIAYVGGSLAVAKATLTLAGSKTYDGTGGFTAAVSARAARSARASMARP